MASVYRRGENWYARYKDAAGRWRLKATSCPTRREAQRLADDLERRAERAHHGLEPVPGDGPAMTFGELYDWWWTDYGSKRRGRRNDDNDVWNRRHLAPLWPRALREVGPELEGVLQGLTGALSPRSINMLRSLVHAVFAKAIRRGHWFGPNPATLVDRRREPKKLRDTLRAEEVPVLLQHLDRRWRPLFACAVWTGLRKGELLGLQKSSVDLSAGTIRVERSYEAETTKGGHADVIPIAAQLRPFLETAIAESKSELVFPAPDGTMYPDDVRLQAVLRRALGRAGIVEGYNNRCRREGCGFVEKSAKEASRRPCPTCGFKLWPQALPRKLRFHDLRGTTATLLARAGVPLTVAQRLLRHQDPRLTANVYTRVDLGDLRAGLERVAIPELFPAHVATVSQGAETGKDEGPGPLDFSSETGPFKWSGRLDLNQRPLAPQALQGVSHGVTPGSTASQAPATIGEPDRRPPSATTENAPIRASHVATVSQAPAALPALPEQLLTVRDVATRLGVCPATVYKLATTGRLTTIRVGESIRCHPRDLAEYLEANRT